MRVEIADDGKGGAETTARHRADRPARPGRGGRRHARRRQPARRRHGHHRLAAARRGVSEPRGSRGYPGRGTTGRAPWPGRADRRDARGLTGPRRPAYGGPREAARDHRLRLRDRRRGAPRPAPRVRLRSRLPRRGGRRSDGARPPPPPGAGRVAARAAGRLRGAAAGARPRRGAVRPARGARRPGTGRWCRTCRRATSGSWPACRRGSSAPDRHVRGAAAVSSAMSAHSGSYTCAVFTWITSRPTGASTAAATRSCRCASSTRLPYAFLPKSRPWA